MLLSIYPPHIATFKLLAVLLWHFWLEIVIVKLNERIVWMKVSSAKLPTEDLNDFRFQFFHKLQLILETTKVKETQCVAWIKDGFWKFPSKSNIVVFHYYIKVEKNVSNEWQIYKCRFKAWFLKNSRSNSLLWYETSLY